MMRCAWSLMLALLVLAAVALNARAVDKKEVTLKGTILCAQCALNDPSVTKCTTAIQVKEGDKEVVYYFDDKGSKEEYHEPVCGGGRKEGSVTGTVAVKNGKKWIKPSKVEYAKK
jgi:hypothetical protein